MKAKNNDLLFSAFVDLEGLVQAYKHALLWFTQGNHAASPEPSRQETRQVLRERKGKITGLLDHIEAETA